MRSFRELVRRRPARCRFAAPMLLCALAVSMARPAPDIFEAVKAGNIAAVRDLVAGDPSVVSARDANGATPLHRAVAAARVEMAELLLANGADLEAKDGEGRTPLLRAATRLPFGYPVAPDRKAVVALLVKRGAALPPAEADARKLFQTAVGQGYRELAEAMIARGADLKAPNDDGGSLLHSAAAGDLPGTIDVLAKAGLDVDGRNRYGLTPLHIAAMTGHRDCAERLIARGAHLDLRCPVGKTAFHYAGEGGFADVKAALADRGADQGPPSFPVLRGPYLGQAPPGEEPELFAPGIVSTLRMEHGPAIFPADGREAYWTRAGGGGDVMMMRVEDGRWTAPRALDLSGLANEEMPALSPDGRKLFVGVESPDGSRRYGIWMSERTETGWSKAAPVGLSAGMDRAGARPRDLQSASVTRDGTLYSAPLESGGGGPIDIVRFRLVDGRYGAPETLGPPLNGEGQELHPFVAPDESYVIFTSYDPDGSEGYRLKISFRRSGGGWSTPADLGEPINGRGTINWLGAVSPDGKYFFFASNRNGNLLDVWWVGAGFIEALRRAAAD